MRTRYDEDIGERAYLVWKECGHNVKKAAQRLAINKKTLSAWRDRCGWMTRALREDKEDRMSEANKDDTRILAGLEAQLQRYERFFETLGPDVNETPRSKRGI